MPSAFFLFRFLFFLLEKQTIAVYVFLRKERSKISPDYFQKVQGFLEIVGRYFKIVGIYFRHLLLQCLRGGEQAIEIAYKCNYLPQYTPRHS